MIHLPRIRILQLLLIAGLILGACVPAVQPASQPSASTPLSTVTRTPFRPVRPTATALPPKATSTAPATATAASSATPTFLIKRVLIISFDGLRPDTIAMAPMPVLSSLMKTGAYTLVAQTIYPSVTLPSHASMLTGTCPSQHGVTWNDYLPQNGYAKGTSLFALAKSAGLYTVMIVGKEKLRQITAPETTDYFRFINDRDTIIADDAAPILKKGFDLAFIHFATTDDMGHNYGWLSPQQLSVIRQGDKALNTVLTALNDAGLRETTLIIISADHGGHDQTHGTRMPEDMTIPWVINGPGVISQTISVPVSTTDTAATAAWALHLTAPSDWVGRPVTEAFGQPPTARVEPRCP